MRIANLLPAVAIGAGVICLLAAARGVPLPVPPGAGVTTVRQVQPACPAPPDDASDPAAVAGDGHTVCVVPTIPPDQEAAAG